MSQSRTHLSQPATNPLARLFADTQRQHRLFSVHWELTHRCPTRCAHCYLDVLPQGASAPDELTTPECVRVLDELADLGALNLAFSGGEILVRRDFFEIAAHARVRRFLLRLFTNGLLVTPTNAPRIAALHPYAVEISVYGANAATHEQITGGAGTFELTVRAFRLLRDCGVRTVLKTPLMRENISEFSALQELANELGASFRFDLTLTPKNSGALTPLAHCLGYADLVRFFRAALDPTHLTERVCQTDEPICNIGGNALVIDPRGEVFPCVQTRIVLGNVRAQTLATIWNTSPLWGKLRALTFEQLPLCGVCTLKQLCLRCHGLALLEAGSLSAPAPANCVEALARRQVLIEKKIVSPDYPIPLHLRVLAANVAGGALV